MTPPRFVTFSAGNRRGYGLVSGNGLIDLSTRYGSTFPTLREVIEAGALTRLADEAAGLPADISLDDIRYEIPVPAPEKIICVGVNFPDRNEEYKDGQAAPANPSLFIRFPRSFTGHSQPLIRPPESPQLDYEGEIVIVIGKGGRRIPEATALDHVAALSLSNEGTIRDWVRHAKFNVTQGKNFDRTGSIGPWLVPFTDEAQLADIKLETRVNGEVRQQDRTSRMIFSFRKIINYVSTFTTLVPGDVIVTGTPTGAGARFDPPIWLKPGDIVEVEAQGIGTLINPVADEA
ncbi:MULTISPECIES: fumarylacetoacetate hydrolase family protein [Ensifer]|uniref:fumarylacetoacetate hydrolase family protein n=1 Tax=Ensifer TaxID=106591 RepID=UPI000713D244|nr:MULTISPECIES: fumarylacetoacetate hydrolase family protein [Ensifer]KQX57211.1 2-hydroxyhepta-2,4-diene-1,7-dioate isomerase [Ensifer sp. Root1298]KQX92519.1 2-hydroxyhepta-2,4-diene-1,7-dioate isomerase [Ensifer sp. Root1312]KRC28390.1 2-hydroxyhepta-2,4-diene-1,7-dioate isomerase [Ensifer sp. Root74]KRD79053.1 2-hydroxyhepta-2,4-diene-1,7-dioate isomerase [Ensifer sp. Root954]MBD9539202.1 fumarylacetoacetate hydrolase family protein [Ensifer sp. ENS04]